MGALIFGFVLGFFAGFILMAILANCKISALEEQINKTWTPEKIERVLNRSGEYAD